METLHGFPFFGVEFDQQAKLVEPAQVQELLDYLSQVATSRPVRDLMVISHGWNNDLADAHGLYAALLEHARAVLEQGLPELGPLAQGALPVLGVFWPSKRFTDEDLIPGGAAGFGAGPVLPGDLVAQLDVLRAAVTQDARGVVVEPARAEALDQAQALLPQLPASAEARRQFADLVRSVLPEPALVAAQGGAVMADDGEHAFRDLASQELLDRLAQPTPAQPVPPADDEGGAAVVGRLSGPGDEGGAAGLGGRLLDGVRNLLNLTTYYVMKGRSGLVGRDGLNEVLHRVAEAQPGLRLHLVGHSFGGRLVTSAALGPDGAAPLPLASLTLLQAAFSHNAFSPSFGGGQRGAFRRVVEERRIRGPILITHTVNDQAVGLAYPLASRISGDDAAGLGGPDDRFGGLGRNGARNTPEADFLAMHPAGQRYSVASGQIGNLEASQFISEHSGLRNDAVAYVFLSAVAAGASAAGGSSGEPGGAATFDPATLDTSVIAIPLLKAIGGELKLIQQRASLRRARDRGEALTPAEARQLAEPLPGGGQVHEVIIDLNLTYAGPRPPDGQNASATAGAGGSSRAKAAERVSGLLDQIRQDRGIVAEADQRLSCPQTPGTGQYLVARLPAEVICELVRRDNLPEPEGQENDGSRVPKTTSRNVPAHRAIYRIWNDFEVRPLVTESISTVKANAAHAAFNARGRDIVWAVIDSGVDEHHRHFADLGNLHPPAPLQHIDFTGSPGGALSDEFGHGTHVAGIIAGSVEAKPGEPTIQAWCRRRDDSGAARPEPIELAKIEGLAPECKILSLKVLDGDGRGRASRLIEALNYIQELNGYGRRIQIHGVNLSVGYGFEPEWFACGQSPLCVEVDRLVRSGVVVVVAAGNTGYGLVDTLDRGQVRAGLPLSINDPGNAELAITVGATHREMPHIYGVSYFSSKGPTGDGRSKPDLVAPGEKIISCATGRKVAEIRADRGETDLVCDYVEDSGTSMAAPHVSGAIAAFLSVRREFIGRPEEVKAVFTSTATDLKRERQFQGAGLVDLMRAIQSV